MEKGINGYVEDSDRSRKAPGDDYGHERPDTIADDEDPTTISTTQDKGSTMAPTPR